MNPTPEGAARYDDIASPPRQWQDQEFPRTIGAKPPNHDLVPAGHYLRMGICSKLGWLVLTVAVAIGLLLSGTLRDWGLTRQLDEMHTNGGQMQLFGTLPFLCPRPHSFSFAKMPDLTGQVAVVTGANTGLGFYTALHLARSGAHVIMGCRSAKRCEAAAAQVTANITAAEGTGRAVAMLVDLASLGSVKSFSAALRQEFGERGIDMLVLNAGYISPDYGLTRDGIEQQWHVNHVAHMYLYTRLEDLSVRAAEQRGKATVTAVASSAHYSAENLPLSIQDINNEADYSSIHRYSQTKLANLLFAMEAQRRVQTRSNKVYINSVHPGVVASEFVRLDSVNAFLGEWFGPLLFSIAKPFVSMIGWDPETAALTQLYAATQSEFKGRYFHPIAREATPSRLATAQNAGKLWAHTNEIIATIKSLHS